MITHLVHMHASVTSTIKGMLREGFLREYWISCILIVNASFILFGAALCFPKIHIVLKIFRVSADKLDLSGGVLKLTHEVNVAVGRHFRFFAQSFSIFQHNLLS